MKVVLLARTITMNTFAVYPPYESCTFGKDPDSEYVCGVAAATCTDWPGNPLMALAGAMASGHESVAEHACFTFGVEGVSRVLLAQLTRHRLASFSVQSQRYCRIDAAQFICPESIASNASWHHAYNRRCREAFIAYQEMVKGGIPEEDARYVLPEGITCRLILTMNARELRHFLGLRMCNRAQWEIRNLADEIYRIVIKEAPTMFRDAGPGCCTKHGCPEGKRSCGHDRKAELSELREEKNA